MIKAPKRCKTHLEILMLEHCSALPAQYLCTILHLFFSRLNATSVVLSLMTAETQLVPLLLLCNCF